MELVETVAPSGGQLTDFQTDGSESSDGMIKQKQFDSCRCVCAQVDLVCHGKTEVFPDKDGSDPYAVSRTSEKQLSAEGAA